MTVLDRLRDLHRLRLVHGGRVFLDRFGVDFGRVGVYVHNLAGPDPGIDVHDHPWQFVTLIVRGGYTEEWCEARDAQEWARTGEIFDRTRPAGTARYPRGERRTWRRWSIHAMPFGVAHRITATEPGTWTVVLRGRKARPWGFFLPTGWVDQRRYPYEVRRPVEVDRHVGGE